MKNVIKIFEKNKICSGRLKLKYGAILYESHDKIFSGQTILKIINFINNVHKKYKNVKIPIIFSFGRVKIIDKLSYILLECICYSLMRDYHHKVYLFWEPEHDILTDGVFSSPLKLLNSKEDDNLNKFLVKFKMEIYQHHFRRIISGENKKDTNYLGNLLQELDSFLKFFFIAEEYRDQITEVIAELVGNACEHGNTDCLLDIDVTNDHLKSVKNITQTGSFYGINIAIVNFSDILLSDGIKDKIKNNKLNVGRYVELEKAYNYHKTLFSEKYLYTDFCNIAALQDKISGRYEHSLSGGTGLTKLIHSLQEKSDTDSCYVVSGDRCVYFVKELLNYDENDWLGFNSQKDFFYAIPDESTTVGCYIYLPGTAYNLNFVMKREDEENEENLFDFLKE